MDFDLGFSISITYGLEVGASCLPVPHWMHIGKKPKPQSAMMVKELDVRKRGRLLD